MMLLWKYAIKGSMSWKPGHYWLRRLIQAPNKQSLWIFLLLGKDSQKKRKSLKTFVILGVGMKEWFWMVKRMGHPVYHLWIIDIPTLKITWILWWSGELALLPHIPRIDCNIQRDHQLYHHHCHRLRHDHSFGHDHGRWKWPSLSVILWFLSYSL